mmetsp:Transcript_40728/g.97751  ORF Transcript_40728/g.97751 Transcript_40728/m.97751 type:complete len:254 (-) Transcript_40728:59-820(-)
MATCEVVTLWICAALFLLAALVFMFKERSYPKAKQFNYTTALMNFIAATAYFFMALAMEDPNVAFPGISLGTIPNGAGGFRKFFWMRYLSWFLTTPLILLDLGMLSGFDFWDNFLMIALDLCMIAAGYVGAGEHSLEWQAFSLSFFFFVALMFFLTTGVLQKANEEANDDRAARMTTLLWLTVIVWCTYPVYFVLVQRNVLSQCAEVVVFAISDVLSKAVFGILLLADEDLLSSLQDGGAGQIAMTTQPQVIA